MSALRAVAEVDRHALHRAAVGVGRVREREGDRLADRRRRRRRRADRDARRHVDVDLHRGRLRGVVVVAVVPLPVLPARPAVAVTVAAFVVVSVDCALPLPSVVATAGDIAPASVVNVTGTPPSRLPFMSNAVGGDQRRAAGRRDRRSGFASTVTLPTAAAPIAILTGVGCRSPTRRPRSR